MAGERTLPGIGLIGFWAEGSNGWKGQNDENLRKLSVLTQAAVISRTTAIPAAPANGSVYLVPANAGANANSFAIRDAGAFVYLPPAEGMLVYVKDTDTYVSFDGAAWNPLTTGFDDAPEDAKLYARKDGDWVEVEIPDLPEISAATNGKVMSNDGTSLIWIDPPTGGGGGGIGEAPEDGKLYGRQNAAWAEVPEGGGGEGGFLARYAIYTEFPILTADISTSAFAQKGTIVKANKPSTLVGAKITVNPGAVGERYQMVVAKMNGATVEDLIYVSPEYVAPNTAARTFAQTFPDYPVVSGNDILVMAVRVDGAATAVARLNFPGSTPTSGMNGFDYLGAVRNTGLIPAEGDQIPTYANNTHVPIGLFILDDDMGNANLVGEAPEDGTEYTRKNGIWVPATGGGGGGGLPDAPADGVGYVRKDNAWVPETLGGGEEPALTAKFWRIDVDEIVNATAIGPMVAELAFMKDGVVIPNGAGTPMASSANATNNAAAAFDSNTTTVWQGSTNAGQWLGFEFTEPVAVDGYRITAGVSDARRFGTPSKTTLRYSTDGVTWNIIGEQVVDAVPFASTEARSYVAVPDPVENTGIEEAPEDGVGYVRKDGGWVPEEIGGGGGGALPFRGALISPSTDQNYASGSAVTIRFATEVYDIGGFYDPTAPNQFTVPEGVSKIRLSAQLGFTALPSGNNQFSFTKNGTRNFIGSGWAVAPSSGYGNPATTFVSPIIEVVPGDVLGIIGYSTQSYSMESETTWFAVEVVESVLGSARVRDLLDTDIPANPAQGDSLVWDDVAKKWKPGVPVVAANVAQGINKPFRGAMVGFAAPKTLTAPMHPVLWDTAAYDTDALWSAASPGRFTIPAGVKKVRLSAGLAANGTVFASNDTMVLSFRKNGVRFQGGQGDSKDIGVWGDPAISTDSPVIPVVPGDYFEVRYNSQNATGKSMHTDSWFAIEIVEVEEVL